MNSNSTDKVGFYRVQGDLYCGGVRVSEIKNNISTPFYLYSHGELMDRLNRFQESFSGYRGVVSYALKANSSRGLVEALANEGAGADVVSAGELYRALKAGIPPNKIVFAGVGKKEEEIKYALDQGILGLNVESVAELDSVEEIARKEGKTASVAMRVKPEIRAENHPYLATGDSSSKFGVARSSALAAYERIGESDHLEPVGVHAHIGSGIGSVKPFGELATFLGKFVTALLEREINLDYVDFGGGYGISAGLGRTVGNPQIRDFISTILENFAGNLEKLKLLVEPGRSIVGPAGILVGDVIRKKSGTDKFFLVTDIGMNDFIRPALYGSEHELALITDKEDQKKTEVVDVVGPICESGDFLARGVEIPVTEAGEGLAVLNAGAYGSSMASNYNSRTRPPEVLVKGNDFEVIRERETFDDLISRERSPSFI